MSVELWTKNIDVEMVEQPVAVYRCWRPGFFAWFGILAFLLKRRPSVVHLQHSMFMFGPGASSEVSTLLLLASVTLLRVPLVVTTHDVPALSQITPQYIRLHKYRFPAQIVRFGLRVVLGALGLIARGVIVHQEALANILHDDYGVARSKVSIVPLAVLPFRDRDAIAARNELRIGRDAPVLLYFGFATGYKGLEALLDAMELLDGRPGSPMLLFGAGYHPKKLGNQEYADYYHALEAKASRLRNVRFIGFIEDADLDDYLAATDVVIFPYIEFQAMSGPLQQCASRSKPLLVSTAIASGIGMLEDASFDVTPATIARVIERYFGDPAFRNRVIAASAACKDSIISDEAAAMTGDIYDGVLALAR